MSKNLENHWDVCIDNGRMVVRGSHDKGTIQLLSVPIPERDAELLGAKPWHEHGYGNLVAYAILYSIFAAMKGEVAAGSHASLWMEDFRARFLDQCEEASPVIHGRDVVAWMKQQMELLLHGRLRSGEKFHPEPSDN
jgi:hypothetical protein